MSHPPDDSQHSDESPEEEHSHAEEEMRSLAPALDEARAGLKSKVQILVDAIPQAHVYIPLAEDLPDTPDGLQVEIKDDLTFRPHMILNHDHSIFAVAYSEPHLVEAMHSALGWETSGEELKFVCVPASVAFELAQMDLEGERVSGLVFNPGTDRELILQGDEAAFLAQGKAIPLVGYVSDLGPDEQGLSIVEGAAKAPEELLSALEIAREANGDLVSFDVQTTFNPERDREPHLSIFLTVVGRDNLDREALAEAVMEEVGPLVPSPGYADIVFRDAPN